MTSRTWCFTWNNYTEDSEMRLQSYNYKLLCYGREIASTGTKHLQGVIVLNIPQRLSHLKSSFGISPHWEVCKNLNASINYCKKDGDYFFFDRRQKRGPKPRTADPVRTQVTNMEEEVERIFREIVLKAKFSLNKRCHSEDRNANNLSGDRGLQPVDQPQGIVYPDL